MQFLPQTLVFTVLHLELFSEFEGEKNPQLLKMPFFTSAFHVFAVTIQRQPFVTQWPLDVSTGLCKHRSKFSISGKLIEKGIYLVYKPSLTLYRVHSSHAVLPSLALSTGRGWQLPVHCTSGEVSQSSPQCLDQNYEDVAR